MKKKEKIVRPVEDLWNLPKDILSNAPIIRMNGGYDISVENFRYILEYTECFICLQCYGFKLYIKGKRLYIPYYGCKDILIKGHLEQVTLQYESC